MDHLAPASDTSYNAVALIKRELLPNQDSGGKRFESPFMGQENDDKLRRIQGGSVRVCIAAIVRIVGSGGFHVLMHWLALWGSAGAHASGFFVDVQSLSSPDEFRAFSAAVLAHSIRSVVALVVLTSMFRPGWTAHTDGQLFYDVPLSRLSIGSAAGSHLPILAGNLIVYTTALQFVAIFFSIFFFYPILLVYGVAIATLFDSLLILVRARRYGKAQRTIKGRRPPEEAS